MSQREAFEAHVREEFGDDWLAKDASGNYVERTTRWALAGFQFGIQHARDVAVRACESRIMGDHNREDQEAQRCADAIKEALK